MRATRRLGEGTRLPPAGPLCAADTGAPHSPPGNPCGNRAYRLANRSPHGPLLPSAGPCPADCCGSRHEPATFTRPGHLFTAGQPWWGHAHWTVGMPGFYRFTATLNQLSATDICRLKVMLPWADQQCIAMPQEAAATQRSGCSRQRCTKDIVHLQACTQQRWTWLLCCPRCHRQDPRCLGGVT